MDAEKDFIFSVFEIFIVERVLEEVPGTELNTEIFETIKADCELIAQHYEELDIDGFSADASKDYKDGIIEYNFNQFVLTPNSVLLSVFPHASSIQFRAEEDLVMMKLTYEDLFLRTEG